MTSVAASAVLVPRFQPTLAPRAGIGTLVALMLPYALAFLVAWCALLVLWMSVGLELGPIGPLSYAGPG